MVKIVLLEIKLSDKKLSDKNFTVRTNVGACSTILIKGGMQSIKVSDINTLVDS